MSEPKLSGFIRIVLGLFLFALGGLAFMLACNLRDERGKIPEPIQHKQEFAAVR